MKIKRTKQLISTVTCLLLVLAVYSQSTIKLHATTDKKAILLGEQLVLTLKADWPANAKISFFNVDTIPHFEILARSVPDTALTQNGISITQQLTLTSFDSGSLLIPSFRVVSNRNMVTPAIKIEVGYTDPFDPDAAYHGFKNVMPAEDAASGRFTWLYLAGALIILLISLWFIFAKEKIKPQAPVIATDIHAYDKALQQLDALKVGDSEPKVFFTRLTQIFREYLLSSKGIYSMQKTTDDLVLQLKSKLPETDVSELSQALRLSDFVKFAKYQPTTAEMSEAREVIRNNIEQIEKTVTAAYDQ